MKKLLLVLLVGVVLMGCSKEEDSSSETPTNVTIEIADLTKLSVRENTQKGIVVGKITSTVKNSNETIFYSIVSQNPSGAVTISGDRIVVANPSLLDYETISKITGTIKATVGKVSSTANFKISIVNVDEFISFKDPKFKSILVGNHSINTNKDGNISELEAMSYYGSIKAPNSSITDVTGIEFFKNVTKISLYNNKISSIDLSQNTKVAQLLLESNNLTSIDVSNLKVLVDLKCHSNLLTKANIANGNNAKMTRVHLHDNKDLTCIKVDNLSESKNNWVKDDTASYNVDCK